MRERFWHRQGVHLPSMLVGSIFNGGFQEMSGGLDGQWIGKRPASAMLVLHPSWMRQRNPNRTPAGQKFYVNGVSVAGGHSNDQGLINTMELLPGPAVYGVEVVVHCYIEIYRTGIKRSNNHGGAGPIESVSGLESYGV